MTKAQLLPWSALALLVVPVLALAARMPAHEAAGVLSATPTVLEAALPEAEPEPIPPLTEARGIQNDALVRYVYESILAWTDVPPATGEFEQVEWGIVSKK